MTQEEGRAKARLQHVSLPVPAGAGEAVRAFYGGVLGLREKPTPKSFAGSGIVWFEAGAGEMELHLLPDPELASKTEKRHFCLAVDDLAAVRRRLEDAGHRPYDGSPIPNRPRIFCRDPFSNLIEFVNITGHYLAE